MSVLDQSQLDRLDHDGYLVVEGVLGDSDLRAIRDEYASILDAITPSLVEHEKLVDRHRDRRSMIGICR